MALLAALGLSASEPAAALLGRVVTRRRAAWRGPLLLRFAAVDEANRARKLAAAGQMEDAIAAAQHALELAGREFPADYPVRAFILDDLVRCTCASIGWTRLWTTADVRSRPSRAQSPARSITRCSPAISRTIHAGRGEYARAEPLYQGAYEIFVAQLGLEHGQTALTARNLAIAYTELSRHDKALVAFERAAASRRQLDGATSAPYATALLDMAGAQLALERIDAARASAQEARGILEGASAGPVPLAEAELTLARAAIRDFSLGESAVPPRHRFAQTRGRR